MRQHFSGAGPGLVGIAAVLGVVLLAACNAAANEPEAPVPEALPAETALEDGVFFDQAADSVVPPMGFEIAGELTQGGWIRGTVPAGTVEASLDNQTLAVASDGTFFAAFNRDAGPVASLTARLADGTVIERGLNISPRDWNIEHINVARRSGGSSEAFMKLRQPELARIGAARALETGAQGWRQDFIWPVKGRISGRFGSQRIYRGEPGSYHSGLDIATGESGTPFVAPADGVVILAAKTPFSLEGYLLMIDHGAGLNSAFLHCSKIEVAEGDHVKQGQVIGRIGMTGRATGPHLHWSMKWHDARLDPLLFTGPLQ